MTVTAPPANPLQEFYESPGVPLRSGPDRAQRQARMLAGMLRDFTGPAVVIDLGCGDGSALAVAAQHNPAHRFTGIDGSGDALRSARALGLTVVRAGVAASLPVADGVADVVIMSELIEHLVDPDGAVAEARRVLRPGGTLVACAPNRDSAPEIAHLVPDWGAASPFDGEEAPDIVAAVFPPDAGDTIGVERWDGPLVTLSGPDHAAGFLRVHGLSEEAARAAATTLDLPLPLTMRGCVVYATRAAGR